MNSDLKRIKKKYGENMMKLCRKLFPTILEKDNLLFEILSSHFAYSKFLYNDIINNDLEDEFKNYIYSFVDVEKQCIYDEDKSVKELLKDAGYTLYECHNEDDIQSFKKYYAKKEKLCTFNSNRLDRCYVFFALKENADKIDRKNFPLPKREDNYGTSVISIQFSRGKTNTLSIKNRYNHSVYNPDATFSNNLDNIRRGLTKAFEKEYNLNINYNNVDFEIPGYVKSKNNKYYKYNYMIDGVYYCPDNIIIDNGEVKKYDKSKYLVTDYFILDLENKKIDTYKKDLEDGFTKSLSNIEKINVKVDKINNNKHIIINDNIEIVLDQYNCIIKYTNPNIRNINNSFMRYNKKLKTLNLPKVETIGTDFLYNNKRLTTLSLKSLKMVDDYFLCSNQNLKNIDLPKVEFVGDKFLYNNENLTKIEMPNLKEVGDSFIKKNRTINVLNLPKLEYIDDDFLVFNEDLTYLNLPSVKRIGNGFVKNSVQIKKVYLKDVEVVGNDFLRDNDKLNQLYLPKLESAGDNFLKFDSYIETLYTPRLKNAGNDFLYHAEELIELYAPELISVGNSFLYYNSKLSELCLKNLEKVGKNFMKFNRKLRLVYLPKLITKENNFLKYNKCLKEFYLVGSKTKKHQKNKMLTLIRKITR